MPLPEQDLRPRVRAQELINHQVRRPGNRAGRKAEIVLQQQVREQHLQLHGGEESPRTGVTARAKVHVGAVRVREIVPVAVGGSLLAQPIVSEAVEVVRVGGHVGVKLDVSGCNADVRASGDVGPV